MFKNYFFKKTNKLSFVFYLDEFIQKRGNQALFLFFCLFIFNSYNLNAQTTIINPTTEGGFNTGTTFESNGWTVSNGTSPIQWVVGTTVNQGTITGNAAYVSIDNGITNSYLGFDASTIYFYRDVTIPAGETNIALQFDWRAVGQNNSSDSWHVLVAPTNTVPMGSETQEVSPPEIPSDLTNAVSLDYGYNSNNGSTYLYQPTVQSAYINIPSTYAGTTFRLIFMWTNDENNGTNPPAAIDNISLISQTATSYVTNASGDFSNPLIWTPNGVPSDDDQVTISTGHTVTLIAKETSVKNLTVDGTLTFNTLTDELIVKENLSISTDGLLELKAGTSGRFLAVSGNITNNGRLDSSAGTLMLNGSTVQTVSGTGVFGGTSATPTSTNNVGLIASLNIDNSNSATPNVIWEFNNIRIKSALNLIHARVALGTNKMIIGNYSAANVFAEIGNGFVSGTIGKWWTTSATGTALTPGLDYTTTTGLYPFLAPSGENRWGFIVRSSNTTAGNTAGEVDMTYNHLDNTSTGLSITDGAYTITNRYDSNWTVTTVGTYAYTSGTYSVGFYATGAFNAQNGNARVMNGFGSAGGTHINGTVTPFAQRTDLNSAQLTADNFYIGYHTNDLTNITSIASGNWNAASTWSTGIVPSCTDFVTIASGHTVTVNSAANIASGINILAGGSLLNVSGDLTVGCTNNNALFSNFGTNIVSGGLLKVNGNVIHNVGSSFSQTNGDIIVDGNNAGDAATSVGSGSALFKILTSSLDLTGGKITIVDPLVNTNLNTTANSYISTTIVTVDGTTQTGNTNSSTSVTLSAGNAGIKVGMNVTGNGIAAGTYVQAISGTNLTLSTAATSSAPGVTLTFSGIAEGSDKLRLDVNASTLPIFPGQSITGPGIAEGTTVLSYLTFGSLQPMITLSQPATVTSATVETLTFGGMNMGANGILSDPAATIANGMYVTGNGIAPATKVASYNANTGLILLSNPTTATLTSTETLSFYDAPSNINDLAFVYNASGHYVSGYGHTLQFGDGVSTEKGTVTTTGFNCNFNQNPNGCFSLGNLIINAPDGENRFFNFISNLNVQSELTVTQGTFKRAGNIYSGGNITNNDTMIINGTLNLFNYLNGSNVPTNNNQTISGTGSFYNDDNIADATGSVITLIVNNTSSNGVTIEVPDFRVTATLNMTAGIIHTSTENLLKHGVLGSTMGAALLGNFSDECYIDGPYERNIGQNQNGAFQLFPVGKSGYTPIWIGLTTQTGENASFRAEAFDSNEGTTSANIANLGQTRWEMTQVSGTFTDYKFQVSEPTLTENNIIVEAASANGVYDNTLGNFADFGLENATSLSQNTDAIVATNYKGFISTATQADCNLIDPGNTIASTTTICGSQPVTLSLENVVLGNGITYQWQMSTDGGTTITDIEGATESTYIATPTTVSSYFCMVSCSFSDATATSIPVEFTFSTNLDTTIGTSLCTAGDATLQATTTLGTISWYADTTSANPLATGNTFTTPVTETTTFYATTELATNYPNAASEFSGTSSSGALFGGFEFDLAGKTILNSVTVYPSQTLANANTPITIGVFDNVGNMVNGTNLVTFTPEVNVGNANTSISQVIELNFTIPAGQGYRLITVDGINNSNKLGVRNSGLTSTTTGPLTIVGRVSSKVGGTVSTTSGYFFWNWNITEVCDSPRVPVMATVTNTTAPTGDATQDACTTATIADFVVTGETNATFTWYASNVSTDILPISTPVVIATSYFVSQTVDGCESPRLEIIANGPCLGTSDVEIAGLKYYPNPVSNWLTINAETPLTKVEVYNLLGQKILVVTPQLNNSSIDLSSLASASYLVKIFSNDKVETVKIVKK